MTADFSDVPGELREAVAATLTRAGVSEGHLSVELVDESRISELNREHRGREAPTDVLSFPVDGVEPIAGPRELGDVVICPAYAEDLVEATVHGVLHLCGHDHETDDGEMLLLQQQIMRDISERALRDISERSLRDISEKSLRDISSASRPGMSRSVEGSLDD